MRSRSTLYFLARAQQPSKQQRKVAWAHPQSHSASSALRSFLSRDPSPSVSTIINHLDCSFIEPTHSFTPLHSRQRSRKLATLSSALDRTTLLHFHIDNSPASLCCCLCIFIIPTDGYCSERQHSFPPHIILCSCNEQAKQSIRPSPPRALVAFRPTRDRRLPERSSFAPTTRPDWFVSRCSSRRVSARYGSRQSLVDANEPPDHFGQSSVN